jgi:hypothetical protein
METYNCEREMQINTLNAELIYMETELKAIKERGEYKEYTALMRTYLATQKAFLKLVCEAEQDETPPDELLAFTGQA